VHVQIIGGFFFNLRFLNFNTLEINFDKTENSEALIKISLKDSDYQPQVTQKIKDFTKKATIKGFRPGKVPFGMINKMYGTQILVEEINKLVSDSLNNYLKESDEQFLGEPLSANDSEHFDWVNQKDFEFKFNVGYAPEFKLIIDKKVKVEYFKIKVDEAVMKETLDNVQKQFGQVTSEEIVADDDTIYGPITSISQLEDKEVTFELKEFDKSTKKKLIGAPAGTTVEIDAKKSFIDASYFARASRLSEEEIKSSKGKYSFTIKGISHTVPAPIDQELFDKTFGKDAVTTEFAFKEKVKETISKNYEMEALRFFHHKIREKLLDETKIALPDKFLKKWLLKSNETMTQEILDKEYKHYATELKWSLIRNRVSKDQDIKIDYEEIIHEAKLILAQQFGGPAILEQLGEQMTPMAENYLKAENGDNYMKVFNEIQSKKVYKFIEEQVSAKEKLVSLDEFRKL